VYSSRHGKRPTPQNATVFHSSDREDKFWGIEKKLHYPKGIFTYLELEIYDDLLKNDEILLCKKVKQRG
jgi:hypothetical protein